MSKPYLYVSTVIRASESAAMTGHFYKIDWRTKAVLAKFPVPACNYIRGARGGSRGGRGMAVLDNSLFAATFDKIIVYSPDFEI